MPRWPTLTLSALLVLAPAAHAQSHDLSRAHEAALTDSLGRFAQDMFAAVRSRDADRAIGMYDRSPRFVHATNGTLESWTALEPQMRAFMGAAKQLDLRWVGTPRVIILSRDVAVITGSTVFSGVDPESKAIPERRGASTAVVQRLPGGWKLVHTHSSTAAGTRSQ